VATITTPELEAVFAKSGQSKKSWNNVRIYVHASRNQRLHALTLV